MELCGLFLAGFLFLCFAYLVGLVVLMTVKFNIPRNRGSAFFSLLVGVFLIIISYSMLKTNFLTVNTITALLCLGYLLVSEKNIGGIQIASKSELTRYIKTCYLFLKVHCLVFLYFLFHYYDFSELSIAYPWYDTCYYSDLSRGLDFTGVENYSSVFFQFINESNIVFYHYFDLWLNVVIHKVYGYDYYHSLTLISYPILMSVFFIGIITPFQEFTNNKAVLTIVLFLVPFAINMPFIGELVFFNNYGLQLNVGEITTHKALINFILLLVAMYTIAYRRLTEFYLTLLICANIYVTTAISIVPSLVLLLIVCFLTRHKLAIGKKEIYQSAGLLLIFTSSTFALKYYNETYLDNNRYTSILGVAFPEIKTICIVFVEYLIKYGIAYLPVLIYTFAILFKLKKSKYPEDLNHYLIFTFFTLCLLLSSVTFSSIFHGVDMDYPQSISNIMPCAFSALLLLGVFYTLKHNLIKNKSIALPILALVSVYSIYGNLNRPSDSKNYSSEYRDSVIKEINSNELAKYITLDLPDTLYQVRSLSVSNYQRNKMGAFLTCCNNISQGLNLPESINPEFNNEENTSAFYNYLKTNNITYIFADGNQKLDLDTNFFKLKYRDENTNEQFIQFVKPEH